jgi:hypothetical protein
MTAVRRMAPNTARRRFDECVGDLLSENKSLLPGYQQPGSSDLYRIGARLTGRQVN